MANLKHFIWEGSRSGLEVDIYGGRVLKVGDGKWIVVEELRLKLEGKGKIFEFEFKGDVEIIMPDLSPRGHCTVILNGKRHADCPYQASGNHLKIEKVADRVLELKAQDGKWSWVGISGVPTWIGVWPKGHALEKGARFGPAED